MVLWGKNAFLTPYPLPQGATSIGQDMYRVLLLPMIAPEVLLMKCLLVHTSMLAECIPGELKGQTVTANKPILVAHFKKRQLIISNPSKQIHSDPFMLIIPQRTVSQVVPFYNVRAYDNRNPAGVYVERYITVVAPTSTLSTIKLDGKPVNVVKFGADSPSNEYSVRMAWRQEWS